MGAERSAPRRVGVYQDGPFRLVESDDGLRVAPDPADAPFFRFVTQVAEPFDSFVVFARVVATDSAGAPSLLPPRTQVVRLPDYGNLRRLHSVAGAAFRTCSSFWRGLSDVDVVWAFGPHPFELALIVLARLRGRRVVLGVRQDTPEYFRARLPSPRWKPILAGIQGMDGLHRLLARRIPATVVGSANAKRYSSRRGRVLMMMPSLVQEADVVREPPQRDWSGVIDLLTVGRIDAEKNPFLLLDALAEIERSRPGRFRLRWAGVGPLADAVRSRANELGIGARVELLGYVPFGPELLDLYRRSHMFVHVSLTEGVPHVLHETLASGTPVVATDVGGVRDALDDGEAGLLVPPGDAAALVAAVFRLADDEELRSRVVEHGLGLARERTLEKEAARAAAFLMNA
ncbi:MAG: glycosyltransferase family 4 protein [Gaiellaceae bacterium]